MDEKHRGRTGRNLTATEDVRWVYNEKSQLWAPQRKQPTGFEEKTLWDELDLFAKLALPLIIALATIGFGLLQFHLATVQQQQDQQRAWDQQQETILQTYIDNIQDLLLKYDLLKSSSTELNSPYYHVAILARARTLTALEGLDPKHRSRLLAFLYQARLIGFAAEGQVQPRIIDLIYAHLSDVSLSGYLNGVNLSGADLSGATLSTADLNGATLSNANLNGAFLDADDLSAADLSAADLSTAHLTIATLRRTNLTGAILFNADLRHSDLSNARLSTADLSNARLSNADFRGADLSGAGLSNADLTRANLSTARHLTQQQLDQVFTCKGAILPNGLTCHYNQ